LKNGPAVTAVETQGKNSNTVIFVVS